MFSLPRKNKLAVIFVAGVMFMALLGACQPISAERATLPWLDEQGGEQESASVDLNELSDTEAALAARAVEDLAETLDVAPDEITQVSMEPVDWPDSSLGCPEPDMMYAQMLTPGYRIVLSAGDETVAYHTTMSADGPLATCEETQ